MIWFCSTAQLGTAYIKKTSISNKQSESMPSEFHVITEQFCCDLRCVLRHTQNMTSIWMHSVISWRISAVGFIYNCNMPCIGQNYNSYLSAVWLCVCVCVKHKLACDKALSLSEAITPPCLHDPNNILVTISKYLDIVICTLQCDITVHIVLLFCHIIISASPLMFMYHPCFSYCTTVVCNMATNKSYISLGHG